MPIHGLHGDVQLRRGQDLHPDHERGRDGDDLLRQHVPWFDQGMGGRNRRRRARRVLPEWQAQLLRTVPADDIQGADGANWAFESKNARKAYIVDDQSLYGHGVAAGLQRLTSRAGRRSPWRRGVRSETPDYQALMTKIADTAPDLVYISATVENNPAKVSSTCAPDAGRPGHLPGRGRSGRPGLIDGAGDAAQRGDSLPSLASRQPSSRAWSRLRDGSARSLDTRRTRTPPSTNARRP